MDYQDAILELHKGKFTTNPTAHLIAYFTGINHIGTMLVMKLENQSTRKPKEVFDVYAPIEEGFADEVFRVFQNKHPEIQLIPLNANESVLGMIKHVRANLCQ